MTCVFIASIGIDRAEKGAADALRHCAGGARGIAGGFTQSAGRQCRGGAAAIRLLPRPLRRQNEIPGGWGMLAELWKDISAFIAAVPPPIVAASLTIYATFMINRVQQRIARRKSTFDVIMNIEKTPDYMKMNRLFSELRRGIGFHHLNSPDSDERRDHRQQILEYLNHYEVVALGIQHKILDETIYKKWMEQAVVRDWNAAAPFIQQERIKWHDGKNRDVYDPTVLEYFEWLACKWPGDAIRLVDQPRKLKSQRAREAGEPAAIAPTQEGAGDGLITA
jgi:hypothetical protein